MRRPHFVLPHMEASAARDVAQFMVVLAAQQRIAAAERDLLRLQVAVLTKRVQELQDGRPVVATVAGLQVQEFATEADLRRSM